MHTFSSSDLQSGSLPRIDPDAVLAAIARHRNTPFVSEATNPAPFQYEASHVPGCIVRVDAGGNRCTGKMIGGKFVSK